MKTKTRKSKPVEFPAGATETPVEEIKEPQEPASFKPKMQIPLKEDGSIDLDSMRPSSVDKLKTAVSSTPGIAGSGFNPEVQGNMFPPQMVAMLYGMIGVASSLVAQKWGKIDKGIADRCFTYTPQEIEMLTGPTSRVLSKYATDWMIKYQDEIALLGLLTTITVGKVNAALMLMRTIHVTANPPETPEKTGDDEQVKPS